jgi:gluconokinase
MSTPLILILMGVSGCGKTTIGELLAQSLGWVFYDGDKFHPSVNVEKMSLGIPLTDEDRSAWLDILKGIIENQISRNEPAIMACSALKRAYRNHLQVDSEIVQFIYLKGTYNLIEKRMLSRKGHYMKAQMLKSQFETLEEPENALTLDINQDPHELVEEIKLYFQINQD